MPLPADSLPSLAPDTLQAAWQAGLTPLARVGDALKDIDTPALVVHLEAFEDNLRAMQALAEQHGVALRPHAKAHRCPEVSLRQLALGAVGICCQKVSETLPFIAAGARDILITNEVVGERKLSLLARLTHQASLAVCVDHAHAATDLSDAIVREGSSIDVLVDLDVGQGRCGVPDARAAVELATHVAGLPGLRFAGLQAYHGGIQHVGNAQARREACEATWRRVREAADALADAGLPCDVITGGGTGTAAWDAASGIYTELQPGSYAFMDADYGGLGWPDGQRPQHSLFLLGTVMSTPTATRAVLDFGLKSVTTESALPDPLDRPNLTCISVSDEHTQLEATEPRWRPALGERLQLVPGHCDPVCNLHDQLVVLRNGQVEALWSVAARGLSR